MKSLERVCYDAKVMAQTVTLTPSTQQKFARLADLLQEASQLMRSIGKGETTVVSENDSFWRDCDELDRAFADRSEQQIVDLVDKAVTAVRTQSPA